MKEMNRFFIEETLFWQDKYASRPIFQAWGFLLNCAPVQLFVPLLSLCSARCRTVVADVAAVAEAGGGGARRRNTKVRKTVC